jgi:protein-tyrosine phosphatase
MRSDIYWIDAEIAGRLGIMARPRSGDWLSDEINAWQEDGVDVVVSLLQKDEVQELELAQEADLCLSAGIEFISFPILDRGVPPSHESTAALAKLLSEKIEGGHAVAIHCRAGIGRSALVAASSLVCLGFTSTEAFDRLSKARGVKVPDTDGQQEWVAGFEKKISRAKDA